MSESSQQLRYDATAASQLLNEHALAEVESAIITARNEVQADVELLNSMSEVPAEKQPLDAGFIELPEMLLDELEVGNHLSLIGRIESTANMLQAEIDRLVLLGIGGSYMGARALFEALCHPFHNQLTREQRAGIPRLAFAGNNLDNDHVAGLLNLLKTAQNPDDLLARWGIVVISKSGGTLETAAAFRIFRKTLEEFYGADSKQSRKYIVPVTGDEGKLRNLSNAQHYPSVFSIPNGVGGRFSVFTAVGLLPAALLGIDIKQLLQGAADMTKRFFNDPFGSNPVLDYTAICHLMERDHGLNIRVLSTWGARLEAVGLWYDQLLSESLGKKEQGATPITGVNTRDLHSRGQQHQEGTRNKLITNLSVETATTTPIPLPEFTDDHDQLNKLSGTTMPQFLVAAMQGTNQAYCDAKRPTADIILPRLNAYAMGELLQMLMLATVLEGRLIKINPYGQPGVEDYKQNMNAILEEHSKA